MGDATGVSWMETRDVTKYPTTMGQSPKENSQCQGCETLLKMKEERTREKKILKNTSTEHKIF